MVGSNSDESDEDDRIRSAVRFLAALDLMGRSAGAETTIGRLDDGAATPHRPWPVHQLASTLRLIRDFPAQDPKVFLERFYYYTAPFPSQSDRRASADDRGRRMLDTAGKPPKMSVFDRLWNEIVRPRDGRSISPRPLGSFASRHPYRIEQIVRDPDNPSQSQVIFVSRSGGDDAEAHQSEHHSVTLTVPSGPLPKGCGTDSSSQPWQSRYWCLTQGLEHTVTSMVQSHGAGHDLLLLSPSGEGKSSAAAYFCSLLGYRRNLVHAHPEMSFQDLFLRRVTTSHGETRWEESTLLSSIREGSVCVLDHAHKLRPDVLAGLQSLCLDRDVWLPDGRRIAPSSHRSLKDNNGCEDRNGGTIETAFNEPSKIVRAHPSFRLIALASTEGNMSWLTQDVQGMLSVIALPPPTADCHRTILHRFASKEDHDDDCPTALVDKLLHVHSSLTTSVAEDCGVQPLSTRNMIRVAKQLSVTSTVSDLHCSIWNVLLADLLPPSQKDTLNAVLRQVGVTGNADALARPTDPPVAVVVNDKTCRIGNLSITRFCARQPERVPAPKFFDIPSHVRVLRELLRSWSRGERAFLLMGNQGVGKNVIVDRLCQLVNYEREYLQLHRDSTIGQLTLQPTLDGGRIVWNDSPLVRAASEGLVLVVDEADKAPTEVVAILKGLVEDGELMLGDGRRISRHESGHGIISMHPNFTLFVLANRPGYPFLGNPFFKQIGDCFETRVVANPDLDSEVRLLQSYGPSLDYSLVKKIASSFSDLRSLVEHGVLTYPYSTREAIAVVKHLEMYPDDSVVRALHNVIDYDTFDPLVYGTLGEVFKRNGVPVESFEAWEEAIRLQGAQLKKDKWVEQIMHERDSSSRMPPPLSFPKEGKWDDKNEPHVGGNQWAGGTGGSDTAGLGGRGGPYRLDRGHKVHQVSDEAKAQVSDEAAAATRAIARQALQEKLNEIDMSEMEWNMYHRFVDSIQQEIQNLRAILNQADVKHSEERWLTRQSHGELDEMRLVEGVTGARNIYKRRSTQSDSVGIFLRPKVFHFVVDVSGSMYRFNGHDGRLTRCLEATSLVMESLNGFERLFEYRIVGHSGDSSSIRFVDDGRPPSNEKRRLQILQQMIAHSQYCQPGDNTLEAIAEAIQEASKDDEARDGGGGAIVVAISDANLERYGIHPRALGRVIESGNDRNVSAHCIFIASFGDEAEAIRRELPVGRGHVCYRTADLPKIVKNIIATQV
jgi:MoxR-like ATPase